MAVSEIAKAISAGFKVLGNWQKTRAVRRYKKAIDAGEEYIHVTECFGKFKTMNREKREIARRKARRAFFRYNQG